MSARGLGTGGSGLCIIAQEGTFALVKADVSAPCSGSFAGERGIEVEEDGTTTLYKKEGGYPRLWKYTLEELLEIRDRVSDAIGRRLNIRFDAVMTCDTCGAVSRADLQLKCGHVKYPEDFPPPVGTIQKVAGGTLRMRLLFGDSSDTEDSYMLFDVPWENQPPVWMTSWLESTRLIDDEVNGKPTKCRCGNQASSDGFCRRCRS